MHPSSILGQASNNLKGNQPSGSDPNRNETGANGAVRAQLSRPVPEVCSAGVPWHRRLWQWLTEEPRPPETLQQRIERVSEASVKRWLDANLSTIVRKTVGADLPDSAPRDQTQFIWRMAQELCRHGMSPYKAHPLARETLTQMLKDEKISFGAPGYDWNGHAAVEVIREYELDHWEASPA